LRHTLNKAGSVRQRVVDRLPGHDHFRHIQREGLLATEECGDLVDGPTNRVAIRWMMESAVIAQRIPSGSRKFSICSIKEDEREFEVK
jgi:hypothetical protein